MVCSPMLQNKKCKEWITKDLCVILRIITSPNHISAAALRHVTILRDKQAPWPRLRQIVFLCFVKCHVLALAISGSKILKVSKTTLKVSCSCCVLHKAILCLPWTGSASLPRLISSAAEKRQSFAPSLVVPATIVLQCCICNCYSFHFIRISFLITLCFFISITTRPQPPAQTLKGAVRPGATCLWKWGKGKGRGH